jgi:hypothetical protein
MQTIELTKQFFLYCMLIWFYNFWDQDKWKEALYAMIIETESDLKQYNTLIWSNTTLSLKGHWSQSKT